MTGPAAAADPRVAHVLVLPPEPASAGRARGLLREVLTRAGRVEWLDTAELACTELITNVVLHAHTAMEVSVTVGEDELLVEVRDSNPLMPVQRSYDSFATTGRGMGLVAALASDHGIRDAGPDGKTAWFVLRDTPGTADEADLLAAWDDSAWDDSAWDDSAWDDATRDAVSSMGLRTAQTPGQTVVLLGIPPTLWFATRQHHDAILRELMLHLATEPAAAAGVDLVAADLARGTISSALWAAVDARDGSGPQEGRLHDATHEPSGALPPMDLELSVTDAVVEAYSRLQDTLDLAEQLAREGTLFARPGLPEVVAVRDWACEQVIAQHAGAPPSPWPGADQEGFVADAVPLGEVDGWDLAPVLESSRAVVAADDTNRIVAASRPLTELLGWGPGELVGRRIVALVPPRLREAHVAGFTRHLATGDTTILGMPVTLPVLRADGSELECHVLIESVAGAAAHRARYLAWFDEPAADPEPSPGPGPVPADPG